MLQELPSYKISFQVNKHCTVVYILQAVNMPTAIYLATRELLFKEKVVYSQMSLKVEAERYYQGPTYTHYYKHSSTKDITTDEGSPYNEKSNDEYGERDGRDEAIIANPPY